MFSFIRPVYLTLLLLPVLGFSQVPDSPVPAGPWVQLENCISVQWEYNDGDSFKVRTAEGEEFIARLYFVDAPEDNLEWADRVQEQADYFGIDQDRTLAVAKEATAFAKAALSKPFTVWTRWRLGGGRSTRWAVMIQTSDGKWLCDEMAKAGLVRIHGIRTPPPDDTGVDDSRAWRERLGVAEEEARREKLGGWSDSSVSPER